MQNRLSADLNFTPEELNTLVELFPQGVCAFDFEMTGLSPVFDKIIEIAAIKITPDATVHTYHELINPLIEIPESTIQYHGLENHHLRDAPTLKKPLKEFYEFYGNAPLIAHGAIFDSSFLIKALHEYRFEIGLSDIFDSCRLARGHFKKKEKKDKEFKAPENYKLSTLAKFFELDFEHHQALDDAYVCLKIFAQVAIQLPAEERKSLVRHFGYVFKLRDFKKQESYALPKKLETLKTYLVHKTPIEIKYNGGKRKDEYRPVKPISLLPMPQGLMLYGVCLLDNMNKYFQTKKIKDVRAIP